MQVDMAAMSGLWSVLLVVFVVIPAVRWTFQSGRPRIRGRRRGWGSEWWGDWDDDGEPRIRRRDFEALRADLDHRLGEIDLLHGRVAELENRLDFTERLLASRESGSITTPRAELAEAPLAPPGGPR